MDLFASDDSPILEALRRIDATRLTPIQALALLDELARAAREGR